MKSQAEELGFFFTAAAAVNLGFQVVFDVLKKSF